MKVEGNSKPTNRQIDGKGARSHPAPSARFVTNHPSSPCLQMLRWCSKKVCAADEE